MRGVTEIQKDIIYYLQTIIDFRDIEPTNNITFNFDNFLAYKKVTKRNFYSISDLLEICTGLINIS